MSRRFTRVKGSQKRGFLLIELLAGMALLALGGLLYSFMVGTLAHNTQQVRLMVMAVTELDRAVQMAERTGSATKKTVEKGPFTITSKDMPMLGQFNGQLLGKKTVPFKLVEITVSWKARGSEQSISGIAGVMV